MYDLFRIASNSSGFVLKPSSNDFNVKFGAHKLNSAFLRGASRRSQSMSIQAVLAPMLINTGLVAENS